ncbi:MAG: ABC transporter permease [Eubacterium sp.]|nr:ABC transporter permease [Eubacterium sp.]
MNNLKYSIDLQQLQKEENCVSIASRDIIPGDENGDYLVVEVKDADPNILVQFHKDELINGYYTANKTNTLIFRIILCVLLDLIAFYIVLHFNSLIDIPVEIYQNRKLALNLAKNDFKQKFAGSYLGIAWAFIQPIVTILVYWFVFTVGFKQPPESGKVLFVPYLVVGIISWFFFSDALSGGTNALVEYNYLVKKVVFNIDILPFVKVTSALFVHFFFTVFAIILSTCMGYTPSMYSLQIIYYIFCDMVFVLGLTYLTSALVVFFKDLGQFINIFVIQIGVWLTPIMWRAEEVLNPLAMKLFKLNPMYYIVSGFRDSLLLRRGFWQGETLLWTIYFWMITILIFGLGVKIFRRLKIHFADVL